MNRRARIKWILLLIVAAIVALATALLRQDVTVLARTQNAPVGTPTAAEAEVATSAAVAAVNDRSRISRLEEDPANSPGSASEDLANTADKTSSAPTATELQASKSAVNSLRDLHRRARAGDKQAAREMVDRLTECAGVAARSQLTTLRLPTSASVFYTAPPIDEAALIANFLQGRDKECLAIYNDPDRRINQQNFMHDILSALDRARQLGDPVADMEYAVLENTQWPYPAALIERLNSRANSGIDLNNPDNVLRLAMLANATDFDSSEAWHLVACDLGYDCSVNGAMSRHLCLMGGSCFADSIHDYYARILPPRQWEIIQAQRQRLVAQIRAGELRDIFVVRPRGG